MFVENFPPLDGDPCLESVFISLEQATTHFTEIGLTSRPLGFDLPEKGGLLDTGATLELDINCVSLDKTSCVFGYR